MNVTPNQVVTATSLTEDLRRLGVQPGSVLLVHASLSALGWVAGGEQAVLEALRTAVGPEGTLVMPAQSWQLCDPAYLNDPQVPERWWPAVRNNLPVFDRHRTPTRTMGAVAELFRSQPESLRSDHPHRSFAAAGPHAETVVARHELAEPVGEGSPLKPLYDLGAQVLLLGVGYGKCTALHLAEERCDYPGKHRVRNGAALKREGRRVWVSWEELWVADDDFTEVGRAFAEATGLERRGAAGRAEAVLVPMRDLVDFAASWFPATRSAEVFGTDPTAS
ncbi:aminoglycoside 3-N-acetyltransferase [Kineococcus xinjiangensis]|uniref:Aminoglycoside N(3)-acetyltransferase n=1 Tax=Kineococcus xinjiangensis TaxID=512762 RepID=A0A2S6IWD7_9ACTN|nr:AAC(3) family N-acetyltransferase [Kineococcus xinjiangensis]PPK98471.1 aminoglycoside 3-N-acetyltransferase [Kineococcus xinjiangensis]